VRDDVVQFPGDPRPFLRPGPRDGFEPLLLGAGGALFLRVGAAPDAGETEPDAERDQQADVGPGDVAQRLADGQRRDVCADPECDHDPRRPGGAPVGVRRSGVDNYQQLKERDQRWLLIHRVQPVDPRRLGHR
jgi:hypothetical protein